MAAGEEGAGRPEEEGAAPARGAGEGQVETEGGCGGGKGKVKAGGSLEAWGSLSGRRSNIYEF